MPPICTQQPLSVTDSASSAASGGARRATCHPGLRYCPAPAAGHLDARGLPMAHGCRRLHAATRNAVTKYFPGVVRQYAEGDRHRPGYHQRHCCRSAIHRAERQAYPCHRPAAAPQNDDLPAFVRQGDRYPRLFAADRAGEPPEAHDSRQPRPLRPDVRLVVAHDFRLAPDPDARGHALHPAPDRPLASATRLRHLPARESCHASGKAATGRGHNEPGSGG